MLLKKITIEKFKKINQVELDLSPLNILVGTNGSGKSSILQAIHLASCLIRQVDRVHPNKTSPVSCFRLQSLMLTVSVTVEKAQFQFLMALRPSLNCSKIAMQSKSTLLAGF